MVIETKNSGRLYKESITGIGDVGFNLECLEQVSGNQHFNVISAL